MLLPHIIEFNSDINKHSKSRTEYLPAVRRYATVAQILGLSSYNEIMTVRSLVNWVQFMLKEMDIPLSVSQMGTVTEEEYFGAIDRMADAPGRRLHRDKSKSAEKKDVNRDIQKTVVNNRKNHLEK